MTDRVFLDANVLFSATCREESGLAVLWKLPNTELVTSAYAATEALNAALQSSYVGHSERLAIVLNDLEILDSDNDEQGEAPQMEHVILVEKDRPILNAALHGKCTHLLTGDRKHFGALYHGAFDAILIMPPGDYIRQRLKHEG